MNRLLILLILCFLSVSRASAYWDTITLCKYTTISSYTTSFTRTINSTVYNPIRYDWSMPGATPSSYSSTTSNSTGPFSYSAAGTYYIDTKFTFSDGFDTTLITLVLVFDPAPPANQLGNDTTYCGNFSRVLNAGNEGSTYLWSPGGQTGKSIAVNAPGTYTVQVSNQCYTGNFSITLTQINLPSISLPDEGTMCDGDETILDAGPNGYTYFWTPGPEITRQITIKRTGTYYVTLTNSAGCEASDSIVMRDSCPPDLLVPTVFTPNKDRLNEFIGPYVNGIHKISFGVYNRWGALMYYTEELHAGWDGNFGGEPAPVGVYMWMITALDSNGYKIVKKGTFVLIR